ncbi:ATP-binding protein [Patiriisocius hiemis]|uniref:histidine kinase n=1 Tax=Patiriisocius hiemis TaxID=3075604 RepID=A0ABU2Y9Q1_9FLAO|nr:ATP-binding protein [Constantimarinum sp. W242]MDT0554384.1 histidine kinase [Constantimarinum sp. W242]
MRKSFLIIFLLCKLIAQSQSTFTHKIFTKNDGLEIDRIKAMEYDDDGFLWLGGIDNDLREIISAKKEPVIQRFNGKKFHSIPIPKNSKKELNSIFQIIKRKDGLFFVHAGDQIFLFNPFTLVFKPLFRELEAKDIYFSNIFFYNKAYYLLTQEKKLITINKITDGLELNPLVSFTKNTSKYLIEESTQFLPFEEYFIISDDNFPVTFVSWEGEILNELPFRLENKKTKLLEKIIIDEVFTKNDTSFFLFRNNSKLHFVNKKNRTLDPVRTLTPSFESNNLKIIQNKPDKPIIATVKGKNVSLFEFKNTTNIETIFSEEIFEINSPLELITKNNSRDIFIGNSKNELHHIGLSSTKIETFLPEIAIRAISKFDDNYLVATENKGWYTLNLEKKEILPYKIYVNGVEEIPNSSRSIFFENNKLWSNAGSNILEIDTEENKNSLHRHFPPSCLAELNNNELIYGTRGYALMRFNKTTKKHTKILTTDSLYIHDIELKNNFLVGATDKGVLTYNFDTQESQFFGKNIFDDSYMLAIEHHPEYGYLIGSRSGKIFQYNKKTNDFTLIYSDKLNAGIATILFKSDTWWINTFNGIVSYNIKSKEETRYSTKDGLSHNETNRYSALDTGDGFLVGTISGLNYFRPEELEPKKNVSKLVLLKTRSFSKKLNKVVSIYNREKLNKTIVLPAEFKELELEFTLTNNTEDRQHNYRYKLNNEDWINNGSSQVIRFPNFAPGKYTLEIDALNFSGKKIGESINLTIISKNFFYKTWWFYLLILVLIISMLTYLLKQAKLKQQLQETFSENLLESQEKERTRIAKDLHDSVGQQLTLIKKKAQNYDQEELALLTNNALEEVRSISRDLYPAVLKQLGLTTSIEQLVYDIDEETTILFSTEIEDIDQIFTEKETVNLYRFIQECLNNIVKHSKATSVEVIIKNKNKHIAISIKDNGAGFDVTNKTSQNSLGLKTLSERIRILGGTLQINSKPTKGTNITAILPTK